MEEVTYIDKCWKCEKEIKDVRDREWDGHTWKHYHQKYVGGERIYPSIPEDVVKYKDWYLLCDTCKQNPLVLKEIQMDMIMRDLRKYNKLLEEAEKKLLDAKNIVETYKEKIAKMNQYSINLVEG